MKHAYLAIVVLSLPVLASANPYICDDALNTCTYRATVTEPTKKVGGAALDNLKQTNLKTSLNGGAYGSLALAATSAAGGGTVGKDITFNTVSCKITTLTVKASATNTLNYEGPETAPVTVSRDRTLDPTCAPAMPGLTVQ